MINSDIWTIETADETFEHEGLIDVAGGALVLWTAGKREIIAAYGVGGWIGVTTDKFAKRNVVVKTPPVDPAPTP